MAPRPEARGSDLFQFNPSLYKEDNGNDEVFGETFALELDALEHTLDEFSRFLKDSPSKEPQVEFEKEIVANNAVIPEVEKSISDLFADEVNALDDIFDEFTKLVHHGEHEELVQRPSTSEECNTNTEALRKTIPNYNGENDVGPDESLGGSANGIRSGLNHESAKKQLDAVLLELELELELENESDEYGLPPSESLDSIYTIAEDNAGNKEQPEPIIVSSLWQCGVMTPLCSLVATNEGTEINDDDTLFSLRQRYKKETVAQSLWNILVLRREQLEIDFPLLLRQFEEERNNVSLPNMSSKKEVEQSSYFSFIYDLLEETTNSSRGSPRMDTLDTLFAYSQGQARLDTLESLHNYSLEQTSLYLMQQKSVAAARTPFSPLVDKEKQRKHDKPQCYKPTSHPETKKEPKHEALGCCMDMNGVSDGHDCGEEIELTWGGVDDIQEVSRNEKLVATENHISSCTEHDKGGNELPTGKTCIENPPVGGLSEDHCGDVEQIRGQVDDMRLMQPALPEHSRKTNDDSSMSDEDAGNPISEQSRPYRIHTKFDFDDETEDGDFRLDDGEDHRDDIELIRCEAHGNCQESREDRDLLAIMSPEDEMANPMQVALSEGSSTTSNEWDVERVRAYKIFTKFDLDDEEEDDDLRLDHGEDCRDEFESRRPEADGMGQKPIRYYPHRLAVEDDITHPVQPEDSMGDSSTTDISGDEEPGDPIAERSSPTYKILAKFDLDDEEDDRDCRLDHGAEYFATMETPKVRNSSHQQQNSRFTFNDSRSSEFSSVGSNVWGQWPFFSPQNDPEDMIVHPPPLPQQEQATGFILQQDTDLSTLSGSFSLEFAPIESSNQCSREVGSLMPTSPTSPYLLRLLGTKNFFPEEAELEYQCFQQTPLKNDQGKNSRLESRPRGNDQTVYDDQRDEWNGYIMHTEQEVTDDEFIHGRRVLSPRNSAVFETRDSPPHDIVLVEKGIKDDGSCSVSTVGNGSIIWGCTTNCGGEEKHGAVPTSENTVDRILLEQCPSERSGYSNGSLLENVNSMVDASKRLLNQILVGAE